MREPALAKRFRCARIPRDSLLRRGQRLQSRSGRVPSIPRPQSSRKNAPQNVHRPRVPPNCVERRVFERPLSRLRLSSLHIARMPGTSRTEGLAQPPKMSPNGFSVVLSANSLERNFGPACKGVLLGRLRSSWLPPAENNDVIISDARKIPSRYFYDLTYTQQGNSVFVAGKFFKSL